MTRRLTIVIGGLALVVATSACGSSAGAKATAPTKPATTPTTLKKENKYYDSGNVVTITANAFEPRVLIATVKVPIHFLNHTKAVVKVQFDHSRDAAGQLIHSSPIPPGGSWSYTPQTWESATYHAVERHSLRGQIQIQPPAEP
jgi:hypothetical protein